MQSSTLILILQLDSDFDDFRFSNLIPILILILQLDSDFDSPTTKIVIQILILILKIRFSLYLIITYTVLLVSTAHNLA